MKLTAFRVSGVLIWLTVLWVLLWDDLTVGNVLAGIAVGFVILSVIHVPTVRRIGDEDIARIDPLRTIHFVGYVIVKLIEANIVLAWEIVTPRNKIRTGVIAVPLRTESEWALMVVANVITITPGTITIEAKGSPPVLYVNVLHLHDIDQIRLNLLRIEELSVRAFGSRQARQQLARDLETARAATDAGGDT